MSKFIGLFFIVLTVLSLYAVDMAIVQSHEEAHQNILNDYGIKNHIELNYNPLSNKSYLGRTIADNKTLYRINCNDSCILQNNFNEIVGYNVESLIFAIFIIHILYISYNEFNKIEERYDYN